MKIIPVIDYMHGQVVMAEKGERKSYKPVASTLCDQSDLHSVIQGFLSLAKFNTIYIADLDSIQNQNLDPSLWPQIFSSYPKLNFWCDIGANVVTWNQIMNAAHNSRPIVGSESFNDLQDLADTLHAIRETRPVLSLDFKDGTLLGPQNLLKELQHWPEDIIVLSLNRVGSFAGPDYELIQKLGAQLPHANLYLGGGIRNINDIKQLQSVDISGVLLAKSLHTQAIDASQLASLIN